jgi:L-asparaginase
MDFRVWQRLAERAAHHLAQPEVAATIVTHGTDTLEETAYFLHRVLSPAKPLVLTAAMRPANSLQADGPQNLLDAVTLARQAGARGVMAVLAGAVHSGAAVRKLHPYRLDAFGSGDAGVLGWIEQGRLRLARDWPACAPLGLKRIRRDEGEWPWVEIVTSCAGSGAAAVDALHAAGVRGIIVAGAGNGHVHVALQEALVRAAAQGTVVRRCSRCLDGQVIDRPDEPFASYGALTPVQARIELMLELLAAS